MTDLWQRLRQRKLVQWAIAYVAFAFALIQVIDVVAQRFGWPDRVEKLIILALAVGFFVVLLLAWYHGERGAQRMSGAELLLLALVLAIGGVVVWRFVGRGAQSNAPRLAAAQTRHATASASPTASTPTLAATNASAPHAASAAPITAQPIPAKSVAVLPFENLSTDKANAYFADGIQDLILTKLADIGDLKVIARTSTEAYGSHPQNLTKVGRQLGVATVLEGSVQKAGNQVLINVQLIDAKTDSHIWAKSYTRTLTNIFGVEGEVADKVAHALDAKLTVNESQAVASIPTHNPQAYNNYLRATHLFNWGSLSVQVTNLPKAIAAYQKAVKEDPNFALAWAGLSNARSDARYWGLNSSRANLRKADAAAKRALTLAPGLPEAHLAMGAVQRFLYHNLDAAHTQYEQAIRLRPNSAGALADLAINDGNRGQTSAAIKTLQRLIALEPTQSAPVAMLGLSQTLAGHYDVARAALARTLAINPMGAGAYWLLSRIDILSNGDIDAATKELAQMPPGMPKNLQVATQRIRLLLYRRDFDGARRLAAAYATQFDSGAGPVTIAMYQANVEWLAGNRKAAREFYRQVIALLAKAEYDVNFVDHDDLSVAYARLGDAAKAMQEIHTAMASARHAHYATRGDFNVPMAKVQLTLGHKQQAIDSLRKALVQPVPGFLAVHVLKLDPTWDPIRHDPGFQALLKKYGKAETATAASTARTGEANLHR